MAKVTMIGKGNMGQAIGDVFKQGGNQVTYLGHDDAVTDLGDIVVLAVPYPAAISIAKANQAALAHKVVVDITNPLNYETWDELVVPADGSAAAEIAALLPASQVVKAFNTTFAATLQSRKVGTATTTVLAASDSDTAKQQLATALTDSGVVFVDAGSLKRAREMESIGFLQMTLAANEKIGWTGGFGLMK
ncbi:diguanylate cyclase [Lactobacillus sp. CBA3605]|uniref:NADPH-dependent F420 reductase n=1 Tax=Lactobacillus sp. CBA3605 TaxID=2099788 RepID=UPI000CFA8B4F|nr:NADPH-dependent F420 reductase [Lactobacillus sp. CBA3605]AVK61236.1 diguanylate cyclase [Lactobacillus sp. CBA3605]